MLILPRIRCDRRCGREKVRKVDETQYSINVRKRKAVKNGFLLILEVKSEKYIKNDPKIGGKRASGALEVTGRRDTEKGENNMKEGLQFRFAGEADTGKILFFIRELAVYEKMADQVVATEAILREWIFEEKRAEVFFAVLEGKEVGFALFFYNFSTFLGRSGLYLEDLFVLPEARGKGIGKAILARLAHLAVERGCGRLEWACLDWNRPSIDFYLSLDAEPMSDWTVYRLTGENLKQLGRQAAPFDPAP